MRLTWKAAWLVVASSVYMLALATAAREAKTVVAEGPSWWPGRLKSHRPPVPGYYTGTASSSNWCTVKPRLQKLPLSERRKRCSIGSGKIGLVTCFLSFTTPRIALCGDEHKGDAIKFRDKLIKKYEDKGAPDIEKEINDFKSLQRLDYPVPLRKVEPPKEPPEKLSAAQPESKDLFHSQNGHFGVFSQFGESGQPISSPKFPGLLDIPDMPEDDMSRMFASLDA